MPNNIDETLKNDTHWEPNSTQVDSWIARAHLIKSKHQFLKKITLSITTITLFISFALWNLIPHPQDQSNNFYKQLSETLLQIEEAYPIDDFQFIDQALSDANIIDFNDE